MADGITQWWTSVRARFGPCSTMVITLDNGPQHHRPRTQCMPRMVAVVHHAHRHVRCAYSPPYHSKDNPIERCWGLVENPWQGTLLGSIETVLVYAETMPGKDMEPVVKLGMTTYKTGVQLTPQAMDKGEKPPQRQPGLKKWCVDISPSPTCGILAHGLLHLGCDTCKQEVLLAFSGKRRGFCPACAGRRMAQTAAHLVEGVIPWVPTRPWVVSVPIPWRSWTTPSRDLTTQVHTILRTTIAQCSVNQAVKRGAERQKVQPGSVTFFQRCGGALQRNVPYHVIVMEGVCLDRTDQGLNPRFVKGEPPSDADMADVVQQSSRRVIRTLRRLGYLAAGKEVPVATGYDPLRDTEPELARAMAASGKQRIACGERAGQNVRRSGAGLGDAGERPARKGPRCASVNGFSLHANTEIPAHRREQLERLMRYTARGAVSLERLEPDANGARMSRCNRPWSDGTTGMKLSPWELLETRAALVPLPRAHLVRSAGCLAPHRTLRAAIMPTPRQQGVDSEAAQTSTPSWHWASLLGRVCALDMAPVFRHCVGGGKRADALRRRSRVRPGDLPGCRRGARRSSAAPPSVGAHAPPASPQAGRRATSHCPGPLSPSTLRVRRSPRPREPRGDVRATAAYVAPAWLEMPFEIVSPQLFPTSRSEALAPETLLPPQRHASSAACPGRALPRHAVLPSTAAGGRRVLGEPPSPRASSGRQRGRMAGAARRKCRLKFLSPRHNSVAGLKTNTVLHGKSFPTFCSRC